MKKYSGVESIHKTKLSEDVRKWINCFLKNTPDSVGSISDGNHSFNQLYSFRLLYNAALFNEWAKLKKYSVQKSYFHNDGSRLGPDWFVVFAELPTGQITNHYEIKYWNLFKIPSVSKLQKPFDGHSAKDVEQRLTSFLLSSF